MCAGLSVDFWLWVVEGGEIFAAGADLAFELSGERIPS